VKIQIIAAVALIVGAARCVHSLGDRLEVGAGELARLLLGAGDRARSRLAMHGRKRRLGRRPTLGCGGVQELRDLEVRLIDAIRARPCMSGRGVEHERHPGHRGRVSNDHRDPFRIGRRKGRAAFAPQRHINVPASRLLGGNETIVREPPWPTRSAPAPRSAPSEQA
jgi:hypothetical protein